jgi:MSHA pilin protein MshC
MRAILKPAMGNAQVRTAGRPEAGFTLIEVVTVLILIGVVTAVILSRVVNIGQVRRTGQANLVRTHLQYAQSMAMKRYGPNPEQPFYWGIKGSGAVYWLFRTDAPQDAAAPDNNPLRLPAEDAPQVPVATLTAFTVYFDRYGRPYTYDGGAGDISQLSSPLVITVNDQTLTITPETGFVQ